MSDFFPNSDELEKTVSPNFRTVSGRMADGKHKFLAGDGDIPILAIIKNDSFSSIQKPVLSADSEKGMTWIVDFNLAKLEFKDIESEAFDQRVLSYLQMLKNDMAITHGVLNFDR